MDIELPIQHVIGNELVVEVKGPEDMNRAVFTKDGTKVGRIVRILGVVDRPLGVVFLSRNVEPGVKSVYIKN